MNLEFLAPYFIGPYGENNDVFEGILTELIRDHIYWRRNIHPEDLPAISTFASQSPEYQSAIAKTRAELHKLTADLKQSVPFFSPRYIGHMCSDLFMPGLIAQMVTTLYNPNNVSFEAATVTVNLELEVGNQFATMFGFNTDKKQSPCAWGHLTSGGTVANYESLWNFRAAKFYPIALAQTQEKLQLDCPSSKVLKSPLNKSTSWELINLSIDQVLELRAETLKYWKEKYPNKMDIIESEVEQQRIEHLGMGIFYSNQWQCKQPLVLVPASAHYSWEKAMKVMGFGSAQLVKVPIKSNMRMDIDALDAILTNAKNHSIPVLACVAIMGTTEFGTVDPIHDIVELRNKYREQGLDFYIHVDAAWGGYLSTMFRKEDGSTISHDDAQSMFRYFPSEEVYQSITHVHQVDSVTIDPHKLGYFPFGAGGFIARNREITKLLTQKAPYVFEEDKDSEATIQFDKLGQYILEGSKPGSMAAASYVTNKVLPLDVNNFGRLIKQTIKTSEYFFDKVLELKEKLKDKVHICLPYTPDTNLICIAINPIGNSSITAMNDFSSSIYQNLKIQKDVAPKNQRFIGSNTYLLRSNVSDELATNLCGLLEIDQKNFVSRIEDETVQSDKIFLLRHTIMNPWLTDNTNGDDYITMYCDYLEELILKQLAS